MRVRNMIAAAALTATMVAAPVAANATPAHHYGHTNYLRAWCDDLKRPTRCVDNLDDGLVTVRDAHGRLRTIGGSDDYRRDLRRIVRFLTAHSHPCAEEGDDACTWDAERQGNGMGQSYIVIGKGDHAVVFYVDGAL